MDWNGRSCKKECMKGKTRECNAGCAFDYESLEECKEMPYGYVNTQGNVNPCFFLRFEVEHYWEPRYLGSWAWDKPDLLPPLNKYDQFQVNCVAEIDSSDADLYIELVKMMNEKRNTMYERDFTNDMRNNSDNNNSTYSGRPFSNENELFGDLEETSESIYNVSDLSISSSSLPNLSDSLLEYFVERKEFFENLLGVGKSVNDFLELQAYLKTELSTVYMDGIKIMKTSWG